MQLNECFGFDGIMERIKMGIENNSQMEFSISIQKWDGK
jgi:hypothetical protein